MIYAKSTTQLNVYVLLDHYLAATTCVIEVCPWDSIIKFAKPQNLIEDIMDFQWALPC